MADTLANPQARFDEAVKLLSEKKTTEGAEVLRELRNGGTTSVGVESNLGRALVEVGDLGQGIPLLMNAVAMERFNSMHRSNLRVAQLKVENGWGTPMSHPAEWASRVSSVLRAQESLALASVVFLVVAYVFILRKAGRIASIAGLVICALVLGVGIFSLTSRTIGVLTKKQSLRSAPLESAEELMVLNPGTRLRILRQSGEFIEVERPNNFRGWLATSSVSRNPY